MDPPDDKLRILSLGPFFVTGEGAAGLASALELNQRLARRGHRVHWFAGPAGVPDTDLQGGVEVHRIAPRHARSLYRLSRTLRKRINRLLDEDGIDVVHIHDPLFAYLAMRNPRLHRLPAVAEYLRDRQVERACLGGFGLLYRLRNYARRRIFKRASTILFHSRYSRDVFLKAFALRGPRLREIPQAVDVEAFQPLGADENAAEARAALGLPENGPLIVTVDGEGGLEGLENVILGVSMAEGPPPGEGLHLLVLGEEPPQAESTQLAHRLGMKGQIHFLGPVLAAAWASYIQLADLFILPAPSPEAVEEEALKALAAAVPAFVPPDSGVAEVLRRVDESLVLWRDTPEAIASAIRPALEHSEASRTLKERCREVALEHAWDAVLGRLEEEYQVLTRKKRP